MQDKDKDKILLKELNSIANQSAPKMIRTLECAKLIISYLNKNYNLGIVLVGGMAAVYHTRNIKVATYDIDLYTHKYNQASNKLVEIGFTRKASFHEMKLEKDIEIGIEFVGISDGLRGVNIEKENHFMIISIEDYLADVILQMGVNENDYQLNIRLEALTSLNGKINYSKAADTVMLQADFPHLVKERWNRLLGKYHIIK